MCIRCRGCSSQRLGVRGGWLKVLERRVCWLLRRRSAGIDLGDRPVYARRVNVPDSQHRKCLGHNLPLATTGSLFTRYHTISDVWPNLYLQDLLSELLIAIFGWCHYLSYGKRNTDQYWLHPVILVILSHVCRSWRQARFSVVS